MKKSELAVVIFMLAFCGFFYVQTFALPKAAQSYPLFVITLLAVLSVLQLIKMVVSCHGHLTVVDDTGTVWKDFLPKQFFTFFIASILFFVAMFFIGFYPTAIIYMALIMKFFHIPAKYSILTIVILMSLIYGVFSEALNVPLPVGELLYDYL
jgi:putative tricarboxylic transport membrane protein